ncbi:MAG: hypothetical protein ACRDPY_29655 [Streptosporangiaceae bacterium]
MSLTRPGMKISIVSGISGVAKVNAAVDGAGDGAVEVTRAAEVQDDEGKVAVRDGFLE